MPVLGSADRIYYSATPFLLENFFYGDYIAWQLNCFPDDGFFPGK